MTRRKSWYRGFLGKKYTKYYSSSRESWSRSSFLRRSFESFRFRSL